MQRLHELLQMGPALGTLARPACPPISWQQERLWYLAQLHPKALDQNLSFTLKLRGTLDLPALNAALCQLWARHEGLRCRFDSRDGRPFQRLHPLDAFHLDHIDVSNCADVRAAAMRLARECIERPYSLSDDPLLRVTLLVLGDDEHLLVFGVHHIVYDAWSQDILIKDLGALYRAQLDDKSSTRELSPLSIQYAEYSLWQRARLAEDGKLRQILLDSRLEAMAGCPGAIALPMAKGVAGERGQRRLVRRSLPSELTNALRGLGLRAGASFFGTLCTGFSSLLHRMTGRDDFFLCTPVAGRPQRELEGLMGYFANLMLLRIDLRDDPSFTELVARCARASADAFAHQELPIQMLAPHYSGEAPLTSVLFGLQNTPGYPLDFTGLDCEEVHVEAGEADFDLYLNIVPRSGSSIELQVTYNGSRLDAESVAALLDDYVDLLERICADPNQRLSDLCTPTCIPQVPATPTRVAQPPSSSSLHSSSKTLRAAIEIAADPNSVLVSYLLDQIVQIAGGSDVCPREPERGLLDLGFDSLKLIELASRVRTALQLEVPVGDLLRSASVLILAEVLLEQLGRRPSLANTSKLGGDREFILL